MYDTCVSQSALVDDSAVPCYRHAMIEAASGLQSAPNGPARVPKTPSFVYDVERLAITASRTQTIAKDAECSLLYSVKANDLPGILASLAPFIDGCSVSSLAEARAARRSLGSSGTVHLCTVAVHPSDADELAELCDYVTFNSPTQLHRWAPAFEGRARIGLRVNPGLSFVGDDRYDPCGAHTKLGVPLQDAADALDWAGAAVDGLHIHSNCDSTNLLELLETVTILESSLSGSFSRIEWVNLGGGYLLNEAADVRPLDDAARLIRDRYCADVILEPGAGLVRDSGCITATVLDLFQSGGKTNAILDTTVNHMPEVFEYQFRPDVMGAGGGVHEYVLAGASCLAGDVFGEYRFEHPLAVGSRIVFENAGAYTVVKANTFNGIPLPSVFELRRDGSFVETAMQRAGRT